MKNLIFLLLLSSFVILSSCAEQRVGERQVKKTLAAAGKTVGENSSLDYTYHSRVDNNDLNCSEIGNFGGIYGLNLSILNSLLGGFQCHGNLSEFIIAVEVNQTGTSGNLFLYFRPNFDKDLEKTPGLSTTNFISVPGKNYYTEVLVTSSFTMQNQSGFNSFGNFYAHLNDGTGTLSMTTSPTGFEYNLSVGAGNGVLINNVLLYHLK